MGSSFLDFFPSLGGIKAKPSLSHIGRTPRLRGQLNQRKSEQVSSGMYFPETSVIATTSFSRLCVCVILSGPYPKETEANWQGSAPLLTHTHTHPHMICVSDPHWPILDHVLGARPVYGK